MTEILVADLRRDEHQQAVIDLLDAYATEPAILGKSLSEEIRRDLIPGLQRHPTTLIFLAYVDGQPAGIAVCFVGFSTFFAKPLINIHDFGVLPEFRGQGIGRQLLEAVEDRALKTGCCSVTLEVDEHNEQARHIYRARGYEHIDRIPNSGRTLFLKKNLMLANNKHSPGERVAPGC